MRRVEWTWEEREEGVNVTDGERVWHRSASAVVERGEGEGGVECSTGRSRWGGRAGNIWAGRLMSAVMGTSEEELLTFCSPPLPPTSSASSCHYPWMCCPSWVKLHMANKVFAVFLTVCVFLCRPSSERSFSFSTSAFAAHRHFSGRMWENRNNVLETDKDMCSGCLENLLDRSL